MREVSDAMQPEPKCQLPEDPFEERPLSLADADAELHRPTVRPRLVTVWLRGPKS